MKTKMKVINMQFSHDFLNSSIKDKEEQANSSDNNKDKQISQRMFEILKQQSIQKLQKFKQFLTDQVLISLNRIIDFFIKKRVKGSKQLQLQKSIVDFNDKSLKENNEKNNKKISQMLIYIEHIKQKLCMKEIQIKYKDQIITSLKKQCDSLKIRMRRQKILKQLGENSTLYLNKLQIASQAYHRPQQLEINVQSPTKSNIFCRTSYQSHRPHWDENQSKEEGFAIHTCSQLKNFKTRQSRRQIRKTFDRIYGKDGHTESLNFQKDQQLGNGLIINQKSINKLQRQSKRRIADHGELRF